MITYINHYKEKEYGVFLYPHGTKESCEYCILLDVDFFNHNELKDYQYMHVHIEAVEVEKANIDDLSSKQRTLYHALVDYLRKNDKAPTNIPTNQ